MFFKKKKNDFLQNTNTLIYYNQLPNSIKTQLSALKRLDKYTSKHVDAVPLYAFKICKQLGLSNERTQYIMVMAYLHDVGKVFIPQEILQKATDFTEEEYEIMQLHAEKGYDICNSFEELRKYAKDVRAHHENLDGSGYPDHLTAQQISFEARVIKVADVYTALKAKRQYKEGFSTVETFEIMYKEVEDNKMDATAVYGLLMAIIEEKEFELKYTKQNLKGYQEQLDYNEHVLKYLEEFMKSKVENGDVGQNRKIRSYLKKLNNFDISSVYDANKLLVYINNNIIQLTKDIKQYYTLKNDMKFLKDYTKKVMEKMKE